MSFEEDLEILADLRLRDSSMYDSSRTRAVDVNSLWQPPTLVAQWRCRYPGCRVEIGVDEDAVERLRVFNEQLARMRELGNTDKTHAIQTHEVMLCDAHLRLFNAKRAEALDARRVELRETIQKLKQSSNPRNEKELIDVLHKRHHPDVDGLLQSLEEKLGSKRKGRSL